MTEKSKHKKTVYVYFCISEETEANSKKAISTLSKHFKERIVNQPTNNNMKYCAKMP